LTNAGLMGGKMDHVINKGIKVSAVILITSTV